MSWADDRRMAAMLGTRHAWYVPAALYEATVMPEAVLAFLGRQGEGWTVAVNPARARGHQPSGAVARPETSHVL